MTDVINKYADASVPGAITRSNPVVADRVMNASKPLTAFGQPCKIVSNKIETIEAGDLAFVFYGILSRLAPSKDGSLTAAFLSGTPDADYPQAVLIKRYIAVVCAIGTPAIEGDVFMRVVADIGKDLGDLEATEDIDIAGAADAGNTGTGVVETETVEDSDLIQAGVYTCVLTETSSTADYTVTAPDGTQMKNGNVATAYDDKGISWNITDAGTMTDGDIFTITVIRNNVKLPNVKWSVAGVDSHDVSEVFIS